MCGIAGYLGNVNRRLISDMVGSLEHRGPDDHGIWCDAGVALGARRLAIVDIESGTQPVFNETRTVIAVLNGEIYNHKELREELEERGHQFRSLHSDTEVIPHLYEEYGLDFPKYLDGMFAIGLWDMHESRLVLVRDHIGIKPLYFAKTTRSFVFGSEPKALLRHPEVSRAPNFEAFHHYFSLKHIPAPLSSFEGVYQLCPGEMLVHEKKSISKNKWWNSVAESWGQSTLEEEQAAAEILRLLKKSVKAQLESDVPVGAYLSGGLDSSAVATLLQEYSSIPIKTFTLVYEESHKGKDADRMLARAIADRIGSEHHEHLMRVSDIPEALSDIVEAFDEPFSGVLSTYFLSQEIRRHVKVALSGDGADELFGSYLSHRLAEPLARSREGKEYLHCFDGQPRTQADLKRFRELRKYRPDVACRMRMYISNDSEVKSLYLPNMGQAVGAISTQDLVAKYYPEVLCSDPINRELFLDQHTLLPDQVLAFVDRLSMANSVEVRPPFLSKEMIRFANRLPGTMKMKNGRSKHILKQAVEGLLPEQVLNRPKEGFLMPMNQWIGGSLFPLFDSVLSDSQLKKHEIFRKERVRALLTEHKLGRRNHGNRLWNLLLFQMWWNQYQD